MEESLHLITAKYVTILTPLRSSEGVAACFPLDPYMPSGTPFDILPVSHFLQRGAGCLFGRSS